MIRNTPWLMKRSLTIRCHPPKRLLLYDATMWWSQGESLHRSSTLAERASAHLQHPIVTTFGTHVDGDATAAEGWREGLMDSKVKPNCHRTALLHSHCTSAVGAISSRASWMCASPLVPSVTAGNQMQYTGNLNCANSASGNIIHCPYDISCGTGATECSDPETIASGNVTAEFHRAKKKLRFSFQIRTKKSTPNWK